MKKFRIYEVESTVPNDESLERETGVTIAEDGRLSSLRISEAYCPECKKRSGKLMSGMQGLKLRSMFECVVCHLKMSYFDVLPSDMHGAEAHFRIPAFEFKARQLFVSGYLENKDGTYENLQITCEPTKE